MNGQARGKDREDLAELTCACLVLLRCFNRSVASAMLSCSHIRERGWNAVGFSGSTETAQQANEGYVRYVLVIYWQ